MDGKNVFASYDPSSRARAAALRSHVDVRAGDTYSTAYPKDWGGEVTVHLKDGASVTAARNACKGDPELPLNRDEMIAKARDLLSFAAVNDVDAVVDGVLGMADGGAVPDFTLQ